MTVKAITDDKPGVTRDRIYGKCRLVNKTFWINRHRGHRRGDAPFLDQIKTQAMLAVNEG